MKRLLTIIICLFLVMMPQAFAQSNQSENIKTATFAGGCFWCMEQPFDVVNGVISTTSGYTGGNKKNPTYQQVSRGGTGHAEAVEIKYDSSKVKYDKLLSIFWRNIDPTVENRQFCDVGSQYRSAIFYHDSQQKQLAEKTKQEVAQKLNTTIHTEIVSAQEFYPAEDYHQNYYQTNKLKYKFYRTACGRDRRLNEIWEES